MCTIWWCVLSRKPIILRRCLLHQVVTFLIKSHDVIIMKNCHERNRFSHRVASVSLNCFKLGRLPNSHNMEHFPTISRRRKMLVTCVRLLGILTCIAWVHTWWVGSCNDVEGDASMRDLCYFWFVYYNATTCQILWLTFQYPPLFVHSAPREVWQEKLISCKSGDSAKCDVFLFASVISQRSPTVSIEIWQVGFVICARIWN